MTVRPAQHDNATNLRYERITFFGPYPKHPTDTPKTTAAHLRSIVKSARDVMRKDKGLSGDLDRLPMLTWIMFLKFLDDMENIREVEATLAGEPYQPDHRAALPLARLGQRRRTASAATTCSAFINQDEATLPDGSRGPGLFKYLRSLQSSNGSGREDIVATVFRGVTNRMESGYLLRDVVNLINRIHFDSSEEIHTLGHAVRDDAAGDARRGRRFGRVLHARGRWCS